MHKFVGPFQKYNCYIINDHLIETEANPNTLSLFKQTLNL